MTPQTLLFLVSMPTFVFCLLAGFGKFCDQLESDDGTGVFWPVLAMASGVCGILSSIPLMTVVIAQHPT